MLMMHKHFEIDYQKFEVVFWRQAPAKRIISLEKPIGNVSNYFLSFPFIFYKITFIKTADEITFISLNVAFSVTGELDNLFKPPLYNIYTSSACCLGNYVYSNFGDVDKLIKDVINYFWSSISNTEVLGMINMYSMKDYWIYDFDKWQEKTKKDLNWIPNQNDLIALDTLVSTSFIDNV